MELLSSHLQTDACTSTVRITAIIHKYWLTAGRFPVFAPELSRCGSSACAVLQGQKKTSMRSKHGPDFVYNIFPQTK